MSRFVNKGGSNSNLFEYHTFDIARQGYINLLPVQNKRRKELGDSGEMIESRRNFLSKGFYNKVSSMINEVTSLNLEKSEGSEKTV